MTNVNKREVLLVVAGVFLVALVAVWIAYNSVSKEEAILVYTPPTILRLVEEAKSSFGRNVDITWGATGTLLAKLETTRQGDVLITADDYYMWKAVEKGLVDNTTIRVVSISIPVLLVRKGLESRIRELGDLGAATYSVSIANPETAPFGRLAKKILEQAGLFDKLKDKLIIQPDVQSAARQVVIGQADVAIVSHTMYYDPWIRDATTIVWINLSQIPEVPCQLVAVTAFSKHREIALEFINHLVSTSKRREVAISYGVIASPENARLVTPYDFDTLKLKLKDYCLVGISE